MGTTDGYDPKFILTAAVLFASVIASFVVAQSNIKSNTEKLDKVEQAHEKVEEIEKDVERNREQLRNQAKGINWIGKAVEELAREQNVPLEPRPVVPE